MINASAIYRRVKELWPDVPQPCDVLVDIKTGTVQIVSGDAGASFVYNPDHLDPMIEAALHAIRRHHAELAAAQR